MGKKDKAKICDVCGREPAKYLMGMGRAPKRWFYVCEACQRELAEANTEHRKRAIEGAYDLPDVQRLHQSGF